MLNRFSEFYHHGSYSVTYAGETFLNALSSGFYFVKSVGYTAMGAGYFAQGIAKSIYCGAKHAPAIVNYAFTANDVSAYETALTNVKSELGEVRENVNQALIPIKKELNSQLNSLASYTTDGIYSGANALGHGFKAGHIALEIASKVLQSTGDVILKISSPEPKKEIGYGRFFQQVQEQPSFEKDNTSILKPGLAC